MASDPSVTEVNDATLVSGGEEEKVDRLTKVEDLIEEMQKEVSELRSSQSELSEKVDRLSKFESQTRWKQAKRGVYPPARRDSSVVNEYVSARAGGEKVKVKDPYRWMENPDSDETKEWVNAQRALLNGFFDAECPDRSKISDRVESMINYERYTCPVVKGDRLFFRHNTGLQNQSLLYVTDSKTFSVKDKRLLIDPNSLSEDGTTSLKATPKSFDGKLMAFAVSRSGSDWTEFQIINVDTGEIFPEVLKWTKFSSVTWTHDNKGFFYNRYATPKQFADGGDDDFKRGTETDKLTNQMLYYHRLGTEQSSDKFIIDSAMLSNPDWLMDLRVTNDGKTLLVELSNDCDPVNRVFLIEIAKFNLDNEESDCDLTEIFNKNVRKLVDSFDYGYQYIHNIDDKYWFTTNESANLYRVVSADLTGVDNAKDAKWAEVVPESEHRLTYTACFNGMMLLNYMEHAKDVFKLLDMDGKPVPGADIMGSLPRSSAAISFSGTPYNEIGFFRYESFCIPPQIYSYNYNTHEMKKVWEISFPGFDRSLSDIYVTKQVFVTSKDGTKVPMFIMHESDLELQGDSPTILYGYGGFDISLIPWFSAKRLSWLRTFKRAVYCVANLRGGGEYGEEWHKSGTKDRKQNVFDDFQSCAEWLISNNYTRADKLAIEGGSNGGLLVGACSNQRGTELYGAAVAHVGVMDMLRYHLHTIGYAWKSDYGCADEDGFDYLYAYSPLHNVKSHLEHSPYQFPAMLCCCADHDDRVVPSHSEKYMATVQYELGKKSKQKNPLLIRIEGKAGHGGSSLRKSIELITDSFAFLQAQLKAKFNP